jgi:hypothetical protein
MYNILTAKLIDLELKLKVNTDELVRIWKGYYKPIPAERTTTITTTVSH